MSKPHKHAEVIKAWADGKAIQWAYKIRPTLDDPMAQREPIWSDSANDTPTFDDSYLWRIKPKTEVHKLRVAMMQHTSSSAPFIRTVITYGDATAVERQAAFVRWLCEWQEVEVEASPKLDSGSWKVWHGFESDGGVAAVKQALEDCAKFGVGAYSVGFDLGKPGGDRSAICGVGVKDGCLFFRHVHINK